MDKLKVIIAGGRDFDNYILLKDAVSRVIVEKAIFPDSTIIVSGMARGADRLGVRFAEDMGLEIARFPADWDKYGKRAGFLRNIEMAKFSSEGIQKGVLVAFWDGESKGTKHMIDTAKDYGLDVRIVYYRKDV